MASASTLLCCQMVVLTATSQCLLGLQGHREISDATIWTTASAVAAVRAATMPLSENMVNTALSSL
jgi:hypothetical protein